MIKLENMLVPLSHYRKWLIPFQDERTRKFIQLAQSLHGDRYDYRFVKIFKIKEKICILCKKHGEFWQPADAHASSHSHRECPECGKENRADSNRFTFKDFLEKSMAAHPNENYDYSRVNYIKNDIPVEIVCPKHGPFFQRPIQHWRGCGCRKCYEEEKAGKSQSFTTEEWILRAKEIHGDDCDYSETVYINSHTKVKIHCNKCGNDFWQVAHYHLNSGGGCPNCNINERASKQRISKEELIERANKIYPPGKYDYSKMEYKNFETPILIYCNDCNT